MTESDLKIDIEEQIRLASVYRDGDGVPKDIERAISLFKEAANNGSAEAQYCLGDLYDDGVRIAKDLPEAERWYRMAAAQGHLSAQLNLGLVLQKTDRKSEAVEFFRQSAEKGAELGKFSGQYSYGRCLLYGIGCEKDYKNAVKWLKAAVAVRENKMALCMLGECYYNGDGVELDYVTAADYFRRSAALDYDDGQYQLGMCYLDGKGVQNNLAEAVKWLKKAARNGNDDAAKKMEELIAKKLAKPSKFDPEDDFKTLNQAAKNGDSVAQFELGEAFHKGTGVEEDMTEAVYWYRLAADQGNADAQWQLADLYECGNHVIHDLPEAVRLALLAAESGHAKGQNLAGYILETGGDDVAADLITALRWYKKAAQQGLSTAQTNYGRCLLYGIGIAFNGGEAFKWLNKALESDPNNLRAMYNLGVCYFHGSHGEKDQAKACELYRKAADGGLCEAQHDLGRCYENGEGLAKNAQEALRWYKAAGDNGSKDAKLKLLELTETLGSAATSLLSEEDKENWLWESANQGNPESGYRYALYLKDMAEPNWKDAVAWLGYAGKNGHEPAWIELAKWYEEGRGVEGGKGVEKDLIEAASIYLSAHERGCPVENDVLRCLKECFENQLFPDGAEEWLNKQSRRNNPKVMMVLATYWRSDKPGGRNFNEALKWYRKACDLGDREAQYQLGRFLIMKNLLNRERTRVVRWWENKLEKGMGEAATTADFDEDKQSGQDKAYEQRSEALKWLHAAADEGSTDALRFLSAMYNRGISLMANSDTAIQYLRRAADLEDAKAQGLLGVALLEGVGVKQNETQAVEWLKKAAEGGDSFAQWNLAMCLIHGTGVDQDRVSAREMFERAAKGGFQQDTFWTEEEFALRFDPVMELFRTLQSRGQKEAQYWLGLCYEFGISTDRDRDKSLELYYLSSQQGYEPAAQAFAQAPENLQALTKKKLSKSATV